MAKKVLPEGPQFIRPITAEAGQSVPWKTHALGFTADGQEVELTTVRYFRAENPGNGRLVFGQRTLRADGGPDQGRHGWMWVDRGGSVIVLYAKIAGELYVGQLDNERGLIDSRSESSEPEERTAGRVREFPRGFHDNEQNDPILTARSETLEEAGVDLASITLTDVTECLGLSGGLNPNSTFFDTTAGNGVSVVAGEVPVAWLEPLDAGVYGLQRAIISRPEGSANAAIGDRVMSCRFHPLCAVRTADMFTNGAVGQLVLYLVLTGQLDLKLR